MIDKLKTFVSKNKQEFDSAEPSQDLWKKIDTKMEAKNASVISSKWLSKLKYFCLSASVLVIAVYFITQKLNNSSSSELAQNTNDSALDNSGEWVKANQNKSDISQAGNDFANTDDKKSRLDDSPQGSSNNSDKSQGVTQNTDENIKRDSVNAKPAETINSESTKPKSENATHSLPNDEENTNLSNEKKENGLVKTAKKGKLYIPEESEKLNYYSGTLYDNASLCAVLHAYKFPGKVSLDASSNYTTHRTLKTTSCNRLANAKSVKAVWLKGKTSKKVTLTINEGFKNILLVKSDGREISPEAISHYYNGLGVITGYSGKHFDMIFKDKVELILFFKDVEEGDKISINGIIEAVVKNSP